MNKWDYAHLDMVSRGGYVEDVIDAMDNSGVDNRLVEILRNANQTLDGESMEDLINEINQQADVIEIHKGVTDWCNSDLPKLLNTLIADLIECKGVKYKAKNAINYFIGSMENSSIGLDSQELVDNLFDSLHKTANKL